MWLIAPCRGQALWADPANGNRNFWVRDEIHWKVPFSLYSVNVILHYIQWGSGVLFFNQATTASQKDQIWILNWTIVVVFVYHFWRCCFPLKKDSHLLFYFSQIGLCVCPGCLRFSASVQRFFRRNTLCCGSVIATRPLRFVVLCCPTKHGKSFRWY